MLCECLSTMPECDTKVLDKILPTGKILQELQINCHIYGGHGKASPKCAKLTNIQYLNNNLSCCFDFLHTGKVP